MPEGVPAPLRTDELPDPPPPPSPRVPGSYTVCEFCRCEVTRNGEVIKMSETARTYRDASESHKKATQVLDEQIAELRSQLSVKEAELSALKSKEKGFFSSY
jgi:hypothetical protein